MSAHSGGGPFPRVGMQWGGAQVLPYQTLQQFASSGASRFTPNYHQVTTAPSQMRPSSTYQGLI